MNIGAGLASASAITPAGANANEIRFNTDAKMQTSIINTLISEGVLVVNGTQWTKFWKPSLYTWGDFLQQGVSSMNYKNSSTPNTSSFGSYNYNGYSDVHYFQIVYGSDALLVYSATNFQNVCGGSGSTNGNPSKCGVLVR